MAPKVKVKEVCERPLLYHRSKAACMLGISVRSLDYLIANKKIRSQKIAKRVLIHEKELQRFARANHHEPLSESESIGVTTAS
jgi:hypothetical protein